MNSETNEIQSIRRVLREIADLAEHATLTGSLSGGAPRVAERYNSMLEYLGREGAVPPGLFKPLPANATYADIGVDARLLSAHLDGDSKSKRKGDASVLLRLAPFVDSQDLTELIREQMRQNANFDMDILTGLAPFMEQSMLGELLRTHIGAAHPKEEPAAPAQPEPKPKADVQADFKPAAAPEAQPARPEDLLQLLKNPHLSESERTDLLEQLSNSIKQ